MVIEQTESDNTEDKSVVRVIILKVNAMGGARGGEVA
jgi:hypothetical protein